MSLTLSVDHRPVDGVVAARWLAVLVDLLEHPVQGPRLAAQPER